MEQKLSISALKGAAVLYRGDFYDLARVLLKMYDAREARTGSKARPTVRGLASKYALLTDIEVDTVLRAVEQEGLPLGALVDYDDDDPT